MITFEKIIQQLEEKQTPTSKKDEAAILIPIINIDDELHLLFQVRSFQLKWQPGDICFPGGRIEHFDITPESAAIRETCEELGVPYESVTILGKLPEFMATVGFEIYPFIGKINSLEKLSINAGEVENIFTVPIKWLINNPPRQATMQVMHKPANDFPFELLPNRSKEWNKRLEYPLYFYHYNNYVIWGLTAQLINMFLDVVIKNE